MSAAAVRLPRSGGAGAAEPGRTAIPEGARRRAIDEARRQGLPAIVDDTETCRRIAVVITAVRLGQ